LRFDLRGRPREFRQQTPTLFQCHQHSTLRSKATAEDGSTLNRQPTSWWRELLWPCPQAWAGLAAVWLLVLGANFTTREAPTVTSRQVLPSPQVRELLKQQEQLLAELVGPMEKPEADRPKPGAPRSQRREEFLNA